LVDAFLVLAFVLAVAMIFSPQMVWAILPLWE